MAVKYRANTSRLFGYLQEADAHTVATLSAKADISQSTARRVMDGKPVSRRIALKVGASLRVANGDEVFEEVPNAEPSEAE